MNDYCSWCNNNIITYTNIAKNTSTISNFNMLTNNWGSNIISTSYCNALTYYNILSQNCPKVYYCTSAIS
ncbi:unknown [Ruminococcus sp. CAG:353]|nr:unknown [Ruminococcus sp. CAG:353]